MKSDRLPSTGVLTLLLFVLIAIAAAIPQPAHAQAASQYRASDRLNNVPVSAANPMPVSGRGAHLVVMPTVTSGSAYASGNVVGGLLTFANVGTTDTAGAVDNGSGLIQAVTLNFKSLQSSDFELWWCGASNLPATTLTDKAAVALATSDFNACRAIPISGSACKASGVSGPSSCSADNLAMPFSLSSGTTGYAFLVTRGTPSFSSTSDVAVNLRIIR